MIPYEILTAKDGPIKLISVDFESFKYWVRGLDLILRNLSSLGKLAQKVKVCCV